MRASFSFSNKKAKIWMPKITRPETKAPMNDVRVCPSVLCADPSIVIVVAEEEALDVRVAVAEVMEAASDVNVPLREVDILAGGDRIPERNFNEP